MDCGCTHLFFHGFPGHGSQEPLTPYLPYLLPFPTFGASPGQPVATPVLAVLLGDPSPWGLQMPLLRDVPLSPAVVAHQRLPKLRQAQAVLNSTHSPREEKLSLPSKEPFPWDLPGKAAVRSAVRSVQQHCASAAGRSLFQTPKKAEVQKNIKAMHQGTQDWDTLWQRFDASGVWQAAEPESQQVPAPDQHTVIAKLLGIQRLAAHLAPEVKEKITQPGFDTTLLISGTMEHKTFHRSQVLALGQHRVRVKWSASPKYKVHKSLLKLQRPTRTSSCRAKAESHFCPLLSKLLFNKPQNH